MLRQGTREIRPSVPVHRAVRPGRCHHRGQLLDTARMSGEREARIDPTATQADRRDPLQ